MYVCRCVYYELYNVSAAVFRRIEAEKSCLLDTAVRCTTPFWGVRDHEHGKMFAGSKRKEGLFKQLICHIHSA